MRTCAGPDDVLGLGDGQNITIIIGVKTLALLIASVLASVVLSRREGMLGHLSQLAEGQAMAQNQISERLQAQERALAKLLGEDMTEISKRTDSTLANIKEQLTVIDTAQKNIDELSAQMMNLQNILTNKQAHNTFGEIQLHDLIQNILPPSTYTFEQTLGNNKRVNCLLKLPNPPDSITIDAKFPLESYRALDNAKNEAKHKQTAHAFNANIIKHIRDIAEKYIVPEETAESTLMFLPSKTVYAELYANFPDVIEKSYLTHVWIVSPTTL